MCQSFMPLIVLGPVEPSNTYEPVVGGEHMYSLPARLTPSMRNVAPVVSTILFPWTCSALAANGAHMFGAPPLPAVPVVPAGPPPPLPAAPVVISIPFAQPTEAAVRTRAHKSQDFGRRAVDIRRTPKMVVTYDGLGARPTAAARSARL